MPCNDYPDPTPQSRDLQRTTSLLIYTLTKLGHKPAMWMKEQAKNPYAVDERAITELCALLKAMSNDQLEQIVYDAHSRNARDLANWWEDHQEADRKREKEEAARKKRKNLRQQALEKLTPAERKALGVK